MDMSRDIIGRSHDMCKSHDIIGRSHDMCKSHDIIGRSHDIIGRSHDGQTQIAVMKSLTLLLWTDQ